MKLGIPLLVIGMALLIIAIPFSILNIIGGVFQATEGNFSRGILAYVGIIGVVAGILMTGIGITRVFKQ